MPIKIISEGLNIGGNPLPVGAVINTLSPSEELAFVTTGKATLLSAGSPGAVLALAQSHVQIVAPADTNENTLWSTVIPAGLMGSNDSLRISLGFGTPNNANNKVIQIRFGGQIATYVNATGGLAATVACMISNRNSVAAQYMHNYTTAVATGVVSAFAVNTAQAQTLQVTMQKASAGDAVTLESVLLEHIRAAN